jgi:membrane protein required for colicin V production
VNYLDFALIVIVGWSVVSGFLAGFTRVGIGFAATVLGVLFGFWFYYIPAEWLQDYLRSTTAANLLGFFAVFTFFILLGAVVGRILARILKFAGLSIFDRLGGAAFGTIRGSVLAVAVVTVVTAFSPQPPPRFIAESKVMPYAATAGNVLAWLAPRTLKDAYHESLEKLRRIWSDPHSRTLKGDSA